MSSSEYMGMFTRKQAGVIYRAVKSGEISMSKDAVSLMYELADEQRYLDGVIGEFILSIRALVDAIISSNLDEAQKIADEVSGR